MCPPPAFGEHTHTHPMAFKGRESLEEGGCVVRCPPPPLVAPRGPPKQQLREGSWAGSDRFLPPPPHQGWLLPPSPLTRPPQEGEGWGQCWGEAWRPPRTVAF